MTFLSELTNHKLWLAPMAGYTDRAFRHLCKENGVDVMVSEMVSADGLIRNTKRTIPYILFDDLERPFGIQIFGSDPYIMAKAAELCLAWNPDFIDLNMGCPVKKVVRKGAGIALMKNPVLAEEIVREVGSVIEKKCFLSAKFRSGWDLTSLNYLDFGLRLQDAGADFLCLHPRTHSQMFSGKANWSHITELKKQLSIPLIGNGDIHIPEDALKMYEETGCDSVMIGRGALGKPWIFNQIHQLEKTGDYTPANRQLILETMFRHIDLATHFKPEDVAVKELRSQLCFYTKGIIGGAELRQAINNAISAEQIKELIKNCEGLKY
ncbi:MAG: tRNA dihydrouridine synthase DusB [Candidatus Cloacimonetes bacterium]